MPLTLDPIAAADAAWSSAFGGRLGILTAVLVAAADFGAGCQQALAGHVIDLEPRAVGILEQHGVVARRVAILLRRVHDAGTDLEEDV